METIPQDRLFLAYDRKLISSDGVAFYFVELMLAAPNDKAALDLVDLTPEWFRREFRAFMIELASANYSYAYVEMGTQPRSLEEIQENTERHAEILSRLAPRILAKIEAVTP